MNDHHDEESPAALRARRKSGHRGRQSPNMPLSRARVMLVDDQAMVRHAMAALIDAQEDMEVFGETGEVDEAISMIRPERCPDLVLIGLSFNGLSGVESLKKLHARFPSLPMLVVSMYDEDRYAECALRAGARGYVMKQQEWPVLMIAVRDVLAGKIYLSDHMSGSLIERIAVGNTEHDTPINRLTPGELEVLHLIGAGHTSREISALLHRSIKTIEVRRANIRRKLKLNKRDDLNRFAADWLREQGGRPA